MKRKTIVSLAAFGVVFICLFNALLSVVLTDSVRNFVRNTLLFSPHAEDFGKIKFVNQEGKEILVESQNEGWIFPTEGEFVVKNGVLEIFNFQFVPVVSPFDGIVSFAENGTVHVFDGNKTCAKISGVEMFGVRKGDFVHQKTVLGLTNGKVYFEVEIDGERFDIQTLLGEFYGQKT